MAITSALRSPKGSEIVGAWSRSCLRHSSTHRRACAGAWKHEAVGSLAGKAT